MPQAVLDQLQGLLEQDLGFMAAALDCLNNMQLQPQLAARVRTMLIGQLPAVDVDDLPALIRHLISSGTDVLTAGQVRGASALPLWAAMTFMCHAVRCIAVTPATLPGARDAM